MINCSYVFRFKRTNFKDIIWSFVTFFGGRLLKGIIDTGVMFVGVDIMNGHSRIVKATAMVMVTMLNYVLCKWFAFCCV